MAPKEAEVMAPMQAPAGNLPAGLSSFVGRDAEVTELERLPSGPGLVTLIAAGLTAVLDVVRDLAEGIHPPVRTLRVDLPLGPSGSGSAG